MPKRFSRVRPGVCAAFLLAPLLLLLVTVPRLASAQQVDAGVSGEPVLEGVSPEEFAALAPLANRGAAILVRDADQGARARISIVVHARAPIDIVRTVITSPEQYTTFMPTLSSVEVISRHGTRVAFRFHVSAIIFDVSVLSALHVVNDHRVDVRIIQSDIGPGASRWDLLPDEDGTLVALSTWGDPSQGNWFLHQVAERSSNAIAGMNISADTILTLGVARHSEILAGRQLPERPTVRDVPPGPLEPPPLGPWVALARRYAIGAVRLDDQGALVQTTMTVWSPETPEAIAARLADVEHYPRIWSSTREVSVVSRHDNVLRYREEIHSALSTTSGEQERTLENGPAGPIVRWHGVSGDYVGNDHRWDLVRDPNGGTAVMFTGGSEYARAGMLSRAVMDRDVWLTPGYAASYLLVWMHPLLVAH